MKILYISQHFNTPEGAGGNRPYQLARTLVGAGHDVTLVCGSYGIGQTGLVSEFRFGCREGMVDGIRVLEFDLRYSNTDGFLKRSLLFLTFAFGGIWIALSRPYDVLFATTTPLTASLPGIFARWLRQKPFIFEVRDLWPELPKAMGVITNPVVLRCMSGLEWLAYRSANRLVGLSPGICEGITKRGVPVERIHMSPNGCDLDIFAPGTQSPWRPENIPKQAFMAIYTGTHGSANGLDAILDAAEELKKRGRDDIFLVLVGDGKQKPALRTRAADERLDNVVFLESVDKRRLAGLMADADIGMQVLANIPAFYYGTSPNKFFDYIAAGLPVLNNYPGWLADMIGKHDCGYVVRPDDSIAFADALIHGADNREEVAKKSECAVALSENQFDRAKLAKNWMAWVTGVT